MGCPVAGGVDGVVGTSYFKIAFKVVEVVYHLLGDVGWESCFLPELPGEVGAEEVEAI